MGDQTFQVYDDGARSGLALQRARRAGPATCTLVVDGALVETQAVGSLRGVEFRVQVRGTLTKLPPTAYSADAAALVADFLLRAAETKHLQTSSILVRVADAFEHWAPALRGCWKADTPLQLASVAIEGGGLLQAFARLYDARALLRLGLRRLPYKLECAAWAVLRRSQPSSGCMRSSWRGASIAAFEIGKILHIYVPTAALRTLVECGCFPVGSACADGLLLFERRTLTWILPLDTGVQGMTRALLELLGSERLAPEPRDDAAATITVPFGRCQRDAAPSVAPHDALRAWRLEACSERGVVLRRAEHGWADAKASASVAAVRDYGELFTSAGVLWKDGGALARLFPHLYERLRRSPSGPLVACFNELRGRALSSEWSLENVDSGGRLSSFGSAIAFCVGAALLGGADAAVYLASHSRAACVGVRLRRNMAVELYDPARMHASPFELAAEHGVGGLLARHGALPLTPPCAPRGGGCYELLCSGKWRLVLVRCVRRDVDVAHVRFLATGSADVVSLSSSTFRAAPEDVQTFVSRQLDE